MELGDLVEKVVETFGVTPTRVSKWLGKPCSCEERKLKLNQLSILVKKIGKNKLVDLNRYLEDLLEERK